MLSFYCTDNLVLGVPFWIPRTHLEFWACSFHWFPSISALGVQCLCRSDLSDNWLEKRAIKSRDELCSVCAAGLVDIYKDFIKAKKSHSWNQSHGHPGVFQASLPINEDWSFTSKKFPELNTICLFLPIRGWNRVKNGLKSTGVDKRQAIHFWSICG